MRLRWRPSFTPDWLPLAGTQYRPTFDGDGNGVTDICESSDCNANDIADSFELANGLATDAGVPDASTKPDATSDASSPDASTVDPGPLVPDPGSDELPTPEGELAANDSAEGTPGTDEQGCNGAGATPSLATVGLGFVGVLAALRRRRDRSPRP
jgi:hypothetical protein